MNLEVNALQQMFSRLKQVQDDWQRQVNSLSVEASAGGGMVTVKMNGQKQRKLKQLIRCDPSAHVVCFRMTGPKSRCVVESLC